MSGEEFQSYHGTRITFLSSSTFLCWLLVGEASTVLHEDTLKLLFELVRLMNTSKSWWFIAVRCPLSDQHVNSIQCKYIQNITLIRITDLTKYFNEYCLSHSIIGSTSLPGHQHVATGLIFSLIGNSKVRETSTIIRNCGGQIGKARFFNRRRVESASKNTESLRVHCFQRDIIPVKSPDTRFCASRCLICSRGCFKL